MFHPLESRLTRRPAPIDVIVATGDPVEDARLDLVSSYPSPLERLYTRHNLLATGRAEGDSHLVHLAIVERLAANQAIAEGQGWTALSLERVAGMGDLRLSGLPAGAQVREIVPDLAPR